MGLFDPVRSLKNIWGHGEDEDYERGRDEQDRDAADTGDEAYSSDYSGYASSYGSASPYGGEKQASERTERPAAERSERLVTERQTAGAAPYNPPYSGKSGYGSAGASGSGIPGGSNNVRRLHAVNPTLRAREKNIYTIKPKRLDEATVAADCLKAGSAVVVNLEAVDRVTAIRIVDFMSGVCYGIDGTDGQGGHAMKLGEMIFLFTPSEFEIMSDETDYAENREHFFREMTEQEAAEQAAAGPAVSPSSYSAPPAAPAPQAVPSFASSYNTPVDYSNSSERRPWER